MSSNPISSMCSYVFHAETHVLWFTTRLNGLYTVKDALVTCRRIILFPQNKQKIEKKWNSALSTSNVYFSHSNATSLLLCLITTTVTSSIWPRCHVPELLNKTAVVQITLRSRWHLFSIPTNTTYYNCAPISMFIPMTMTRLKTEKK